MTQAEDSEKPERTRNGHDKGIGNGSEHAPENGPTSDSDRNLDEAGRRRKRTNAYLAMWAIEADISIIPIPTSHEVAVQSVENVVGRAKVYCLTSLKGQGLSQHEVFAFADAYDVWDHLDHYENDYVLDPDPSPASNINYAWRCEALWAAEFVLGFVRHLGYPDHPSDPAKSVELCIQEICAKTDRKHTLRPVKELLDTADVTRCLDAVSRVFKDRHESPPSGLQGGVVAERLGFFSWLIAG